MLRRTPGRLVFAAIVASVLVRRVRLRQRLLSRTRQVVRIAKLPGAARCSRADLVIALVLRSLSRRRDFRVRLPAAAVFLARESFPIDVQQLLDILGRQPYVTDYTGASVLDIGGHKGYYGAYALSAGAACVSSFEPELSNFEYLQRSAAAATGPRRRWVAEKIAVGGAEGYADLTVSQESWAHSLVSGSDADRTRAGSDRVRVTPASRLIDEAAARTAARLIVKINAEGAECEIVLATPPEKWRLVDEVFVEFHRFAPCRRDEILTHLETAGFELSNELAFGGGSNLHLVRRGSST